MLPHTLQFFGEGASPPYWVEAGKAFCAGWKLLVAEVWCGDGVVVGLLLTEKKLKQLCLVNVGFPKACDMMPSGFPAELTEGGELKITHVKLGALRTLFGTLC